MLGVAAIAEIEQMVDAGGFEGWMLSPINTRRVMGNSQIAQRSAIGYIAEIWNDTIFRPRTHRETRL